MQQSDDPLPPLFGNTSAVRVVAANWPMTCAEPCERSPVLPVLLDPEQFAVKELDQIVTNRLKRTDPVLLAVWKAAKRLEQPPQPEEEAPTAPPVPAP